MVQDQSWAPAAPELFLPPELRRDRFDAMGTSVSVLLPFARAASGYRQVRGLFQEWEDRLSRFLPESELSFVNRHADTPVKVSPLFLRVLMSALDGARATDGIYDPTLLNQLVGVGYDRTFAALPPDRPAGTYRAVPGSGWRWIKVDPVHRVVTLPAGTALDFGGIAKGMAVDAALEQVVQSGAGQAAVEAGGDLRVHGLPPGRPDWTVAIQVEDKYETVSLYRGALATSTVARRRWKQGGEERHHLIDPRTGQPTSNGLLSVSVVAPRCALADVAAKVALVLGPGAGAEFLIRHDLAALLLERDGVSRRVGPWLEGSEKRAS